MLLQENGRAITAESGQTHLLLEDDVTITDPTAIKFSNEQARVAADKLAQSYALCDAARDRWDSLGGGQTAIDVMESDIRSAADSVVVAYQHCFLAEKLWFLGTNIIIPNTSEAIGDGSPADSRPAATGAKVHGVMDRAVQMQNWLFSATQSFTDTARNNAATFNTVIEASSNGPPTMTVAAAGNMMTRCSELRTNYEANTQANLNALLAFAVNP
jgi:hypothetical protein